MNPESILDYKFKNKKLLDQAFSHSSYVYEKNSPYLENNERLEFLGDAVLQIQISKYLFETYPKMQEGDLTKLRSKIVCGINLAQIARAMNLGSCIYLGKGEERNGGRDRESILADVFEAIIGAIYLDGGNEKVWEFVQKFVLPTINTLEEERLDYKTHLQELVQKAGKNPLKYTTIGEEGYDHNKTFTVQVFHEDKLLGIGQGRSKKDAEQMAAKEALKNRDEIN